MKGKLGLIVTLAFIGIIALSTILLGVIKTDYSPSFNPTINSVKIKLDQSNTEILATRTTTIEKDKKLFNDVVKLYENSFKQSILAGLFSGNIKTQAIVDYKSGSYSSQLSGQSGHQIIFSLNGATIKETAGSNEHKISEIAFKVDDKEGFNTIIIYGRVEGSSTNHVEIITKANTKALYDFVSELDK